MANAVTERVSDAVVEMTPDEAHLALTDAVEEYEEVEAMVSKAIYLAKENEAWLHDEGEEVDAYQKLVEDGKAVNLFAAYCSKEFGYGKSHAYRMAGHGMLRLAIEAADDDEGTVVAIMDRSSERALRDLASEKVVDEFGLEAVAEAILAAAESADKRADEARRAAAELAAAEAEKAAAEAEAKGEEPPVAEPAPLPSEETAPDITSADVAAGMRVQGMESAIKEGPKPKTAAERKRGAKESGEAAVALLMETAGWTQLRSLAIAIMDQLAEGPAPARKELDKLESALAFAKERADEVAAEG